MTKVKSIGKHRRNGVAIDSLEGDGKDEALSSAQGAPTGLKALGLGRRNGTQSLS
jgi:hypothetical protein